MPADTILVIGSDLQSRDLLARGVKAVRAGACDFLVKPVQPEVLRDAIHRGLALNGHEATLDLSPAAVAEVDRSPYNLDLLFRGSERMRAVEDIVRRAADTNVTVLLTGESGVGKEMVARAIHQISGRLDKPFVKVNCASLPAELLESELFGHEKGAFTGAHRRKPGQIE